jgi:hypothetical protein
MFESTWRADNKARVGIGLTEGAMSDPFVYFEHDEKRLYYPDGDDPEIAEWLRQQLEREDEQREA